jgi:tetratricopeptide (TPR) repeat protein
MDAFWQALQYHQAGKLDVAEQLYRQILQTDPRHADSYHLLGVAAYQQGRHDQALALIRQALALNPWAAVYHSNLGVVHEAIGQKHEALTCFEQALRLQTGSPEAHNAVGNALRAVGRLTESQAHCLEALRLRPNYVEARDNLGSALYLQGKLDEAIIHYQEALRLRPDYAKTHGHLALALADTGKTAEALSHYHEALRLDPANAEAHNNLGIVLLKENQLDDAIAHCQEALRLMPNFAGAHNNLSIAFRRIGRLDDAVRHGQEALRIEQQFPEAHNSLATALVRKANWDEAMTHYQEAVRHKPNLGEARWNRALLWLLLGDCEQGWPEYEWRWTQPGHNRPQFPQSVWDGSDLQGRTILLYTEQGIGDTLQFVRFALVVKQRGGTVIVQCQKALKRLLKGAPGIDLLVSTDDQQPAFDVQAPLFSLPDIFHIQLEGIPAAVPYLHPDAGLVEHWKRVDRLQDAESKRSSTPYSATRTPHFKVGIGWQGSPTYGYDNLRSVPLAEFAPLVQIEGVQLISLQKGAGTEQLRSTECGVRREGQHDSSNLQSPIFTPLIDEDSGPFMDTAAILKTIDLVICTDTALPHLAGALGVPAWLAVPYVPDWRWLLEREDSPWYPTMRLFRQKQHGDWTSVFERIADELKKVARLAHP